MDINHKTIGLMKNIILIILATRGSSFLIINFICILYNILFDETLISRITIPSIFILTCLCSTALFKLQDLLCVLCLKLTICTTISSLSVTIYKNCYLSGGILSANIFLPYIVGTLGMALVTASLFFKSPNSILGFISTTFWLLLSEFIIEYCSILVPLNKYIFGISQKLFVTELEFVLQAIITSIAYIIFYLYTYDDEYD